MTALGKAEFDAFCEEVEDAVNSCLAPRRKAEIAELAYRMMDDGSSLESRRAARDKIASRAKALYARCSFGQSSAVDKYCENQLGVEAVPNVYELPDEQVYEQIGYYAGSIKEPKDASAFANRLLSWVSKKSEYVTNKKMVANVESYRHRTGKAIKYAYVPTESEICGFCCMMAGRGFEFGPESADSLHPHCKCRKMPNVKGESIPGYDKDSYESRYKLCRSTVSDNLTMARYLKSGSDADYDEWVTSEIVKEMDTRDKRWLRYGTPSEITFENDFVRSKVEKEGQHELATAKKLCRIGIKTDFAVDEKYIDGRMVGFADFADGTEIKTLTSCSSKNTVESHLRNAAKKSNSVSVIFDNSENEAMSDESLKKLLSESRRARRLRIYVYTRDNELKRVH